MAVTGEEGYFNTKVAYIAESGSPKKRVKRLAIMDADGYNNRYLSSGKNLVTPPQRISPGWDNMFFSFKSWIFFKFLRGKLIDLCHFSC